jgi:tRNA dimethylallyltransferase
LLFQPIGQHRLPASLFLIVNSTPAPLFIIVGPTAVGKSELAVAVAERCGGEIVSADAFQIYQGLDILTAKPSPALRARVPHHLIGEIPLSQSFDVAQYLRLAQERIAAIHTRRRVPVIVGGTGLYLRALTHGLAELPSADGALRAKLELQTTGELCKQLAALDSTAHAQIDRQNRRRVIRALEVCLLTGQPFSSFRDQWATPSIAARGVVLNRPREELHDRIHRRTEGMFTEGVIEEVRQTTLVGPTASQTLGYREIRMLLEGTITREETIASIQQATRRYAKRQLTWFRREQHLQSVELSGDELPSALVEEWAHSASSVLD